VKIIVHGLPSGHDVIGMDVVIECRCGDMFHGDTIEHAVVDWETHLSEVHDDGVAS
jgi:hypothetical protein